MASGKALLRKYIKKFHKKEIKELKSQNRQCKISIDYESLNTWLLTQSGQDFWELQIYEYIDQMEKKNLMILSRQDFVISVHGLMNSPTRCGC